jgi:hypothetical protein
VDGWGYPEKVDKPGKVGYDEENSPTKEEV